MPELLLELGCEELPASFVAGSFAQLRDGVVSRLDAARLTHGEAEAYGTPRRLIVVVRDIIDRQSDDTKEQRGPRLAAAFDESGAPTKALEGFCRGQGVTPDEVRKEDDYVWVTKHIPGRPAAEVLSEILPEAIRALTFEKSMRWGAGGMRFARPIRWILALFNGAVIPLAVEGVRSDTFTRGHRFLAPDAVPVNGFESYSDVLRRASVEFDPARRRATIMECAQALVPDGTVDATDDIVDENVYLTEWPMPSLGSFDASFLSLPSDVLVVAMKKHEKFLPVRDRDGKLTNRFISIRNAGDEKTVIAGNEAVLEARFNDAKFFFDEDAKHPLSWFAERLDRVVFQEKLGTLKQKTERLVGLCESIARAVGLSEAEVALAKRAASLAKADLATGLVMELPALQGIVGGEYARRDGESEEVCWAIRTHYNPEAPPDTLANRLARILMAADRIDTLVGYLGLGLVPSGSSDPFGLRRAMNMLILNGIEWGIEDAGIPDPKERGDYEWALVEDGDGTSDAALGPRSTDLDTAVASFYGIKIPPSTSGAFLNLRWLSVLGLRGYSHQGHNFDPPAVREALGQLAVARYVALYADVRDDLRDAALAVSWDAPARLDRRANLLHDRSSRSDFTTCARAATRPINIVRAARRGVDIRALVARGEKLPGWVLHGQKALDRVTPERFEHPAENVLFQAVCAVRDAAGELARVGDYGQLWDLLHDHLAKPIADFFDNVMVMVEDEKVRDNRLTLLSAIASMYLQIADFSKIVIEGE